MGKERYRGTADQMSLVYAIVEGETEETFIRDILAPHLALGGIYLSSILLRTKLVKYLRPEDRGRPGRIFKGGVSSYAKIERDVRHQLRNKPGARAITTMIDYYGLPGDFPGLDELPSGNAYDRVAHLERAFENDINSRHFRPFLMLHEFEALLFTDTSQIAAVFSGQRIAEPLAAIQAAFDSPEEIDEGLTTHPSARMTAIVTGYRKPLHGSLISQRIGLSAFRQHCPHFGEWVTWLESLSD